MKRTTAVSTSLTSFALVAATVVGGSAGVAQAAPPATSASTTQTAPVVQGARRAVAGPAGPDLVVTWVGWDRFNSPAIGEAERFDAVVENRGTAPTPAGTIIGVGFQVDGVLQTWSDTFRTSLAPGEAVSVSANSGPRGSDTWIATGGRHEVLAFVDDAARITERDEGNNRTTKTIDVIGSGPVRSTGLDGANPVTTIRRQPTATGLASSVTGSLYGGCERDGRLVGPETYLGEGGAGNDYYASGGVFAWSGIGTVPAGSTRATSSGIDLGVIEKFNYGWPASVISCPAGAEAGFTRLHVTRLKTIAYADAVEHVSTGRVLGARISSVSVDLPM